MLVTPLKERERRSTWKDGGKDTPVIQLKTAFIEIDGQPMMMMIYLWFFEPVPDSDINNSVAFFLNVNTHLNMYSRVEAL